MSATAPEKSVQKVQEKVQQAANDATTSAPRRRYRSILFQFGIISVSSAFAFLTMLANSTPFFPLDVQITRSIQLIGNPAFAQFMSLISWPGFPPQSFVIPLFIAALIYSLGLHWEGVAALIAALSSAAINVFVKDLIRRPRPTMSLVHVFRILDSYSFPSGHVMFYVVFFGFLIFLAFALLKRSFKRTLLIAICGALVLLVGISRIYLGQHWASDVLGAYLLGSLTLVVNVVFYRWGKKRFFVTQPVNASEQPGPPQAAGR
jgi:membrane-associated phospholipid phosphatase